MSTYALVTAERGLNIREPAKLTELTLLDTVPKDTVLLVSPLTDIVQIELDDGSIGWASAKWLQDYEGEVVHDEQMATVFSDEPPWLSVARGEIGVHEVSGNEDNPRIVEYHAATTLKATDDETPWCSAFVNWCLQEVGFRGTRSAMARSFLDWGDAVDNPVPGDITVFARGTGNQGHVGFYLGCSGGSIKVLGGNQSDEVNVSYYSDDRLLGYRRPTA